MTARISDRKNQKGFLIHNEEKYHNCLNEIDNDRLQSLITEDLMHWEAISRVHVRNQNVFKEQIDMFLKSHNEQLEEILFSHASAFAIPDLRKLPIASSIHKNGKIDFEWPTKSLLKEWKVVVKIAKIEFWYYPGYKFLTGIRVTLSNGYHSPIFQTTADQQRGPFTLQLDQTDKVKYLAVRSREDGVYGLKFCNKYRETAAEWSGDLTQGWIEQKVPNGVDIVGVYGLNGYGGKGIQNLGFITASHI